MRLVGHPFVAVVCFAACDAAPVPTAADAAVDRAVEAGASPCASDRECSASGLVCNTVAGRCVECNRASDCGAERACVAGRCVTPTRCTTSRTCPGQVCSARLGYCVDCEADVDCGSGQVCRDNLCAAAPRACRSSRECSAMGQVCDAVRSICVECSGDADCPMDRYCGPQSTCVVRVCAPNAATCLGAARVGLCDPRGASQQEMDCPSGQVCNAGRCQAVACAPGSSSCVDGRSARVCAANGASFATVACAAGVACVGTRCANWSCVPASVDCPAAGSTRSICNADGLGRRTEPCPTPPNARSPRCGADGGCTFECAPGFADCDGAPTTGCEAATATDARNCGACGMACPAGIACVEGRCAAATAAPPTPMAQARFAAATVVLADGRVLVAGGFARDTALHSTEIYDPVVGRWSAGPNLPTTLAGAAGARARDGSVFVFGGIAEGVGGVNAVYRLDAAGSAWRAVTPLNMLRSFPCAVAAPDGRVFVLGGYRGNAGSAALSSVEVYDPSMDRWSPLAVGLNPERAAAAAALTPAGTLAVFGGYNTNGSGNHLVSTDLLDPANGAWTGGPSMPMSLAGLSAVLASDGLVHLVGGYNRTGNVAVHYAYDAPARSFRTLAPLPTARSFIGLVEAPRGTLLAIGGREGPSNATVATVSAYSIATDSWR